MLDLARRGYGGQRNEDDGQVLTITHCGPYPCAGNFRPEHRSFPSGFRSDLVGKSLPSADGGSRRERPGRLGVWICWSLFGDFRLSLPNGSVETAIIRPKWPRQFSLSTMIRYSARWLQACWPTAV